MIKKVLKFALPYLAKQLARYSLRYKVPRMVRAYYLTLTGQQKEEAARREAICMDCSFEEGGKCAICGCPLLFKTRDLADGCPHPEGSKWL